MPAQIAALVVSVVAMSSSAPLLADDLRGANSFLCAAAEALLCKRPFSHRIAGS
jgi:hypothetical protein